MVVVVGIAASQLQIVASKCISASQRSARAAQVNQGSLQSTNHHLALTRQRYMLPLNQESRVSLGTVSD